MLIDWLYVPYYYSFIITGYTSTTESTAEITFFQHFLERLSASIWNRKQHFDLMWKNYKFSTLIIVVNNLLYMCQALKDIKEWKINPV